MATSREKNEKELSSKLSNLDRAYLAGLFDGEGCISPSWCSRQNFLKKEQRTKVSHYPRLQFVISSKNYLLLDLVKTIIGFGHVYKGSNGWDYRVSAQKEVLNVVKTLIPYVRLKKDLLHVAKDALSYQLQRKSHAKWTSKEKVFFYNKFMLRLLKLLPSGEKRGRPSKYSLEDRLYSE